MTDRAFKAIVAGVIAFGIAAIALAEYAEAQPAPQMDCRPSKQIYEELHKAEMSEVAVMGVNPQVIWLVYATPGGDLWKLVSTRVDGTSCIVVSGAGYENIPVTPKGRPA